MMEVQPDPVMSIECVLVATALLSVEGITITAIVFTHTLEMTGAAPVCSVNDDSILTNITTNSESVSDED